MRIGIDLGGSKIEGVVLAADGQLLFRKRVPTPSHDYHAIIETIASLVAQLEAKWGQLCRVGVGTPGVEDSASGLMKNCNTTCLNGKLLRQDLSQRLDREVRLANDANCFALSEAVDGAAAPYQTVFAVILGTGVGGGIVINKSLVVGANGIAGEWGHNPVVDGEQQRPCYCQRYDCIETHLSGPGLQESYRRRSGETITPAVLLTRMNEGDALAAEVLDAYCQQLARALAGVINLLDPDAIVLGGGLSNMDVLYQRLPTYWQRWIFSDSCHTRLLKAQYGDSSGVRGAAWLW